MNNFGELLGHSLLSDQQFVYTYSHSFVLILEKTTMKLIHKIQIDQEILQIGLNDDLYVLTKNATFLQIAIDGQIINSVQNNDIIDLSCAIFHNEYFYTYYDGQIIQISNKVTQILPCTIECSQLLYLPLKNQFIVLDRDTLYLLDQLKITILKQFNHSITAIAYESNLIACGDEQGKLIVLKLVENQLTIQMQQQWHSHPIQTIVFYGENIYTAGQEGVVVQWNLGNQKKSFFPRQGGNIVALHCTEDIVIVNIQCLNQIKQVSLVGQNVVPTYHGIQESNIKNYQSYQNRLLINGVSGQLQLINPQIGQFVQNINICNKNYVSDIDSNFVRNRMEISQFVIIDKYLVCIVQSTISNTIQFYENVHNYQFNLISLANIQQSILGISAYQDSEGLIILTWSLNQVRAWKLITNSKGTQQWNCVFKGENYKGQQIYAVTYINSQILVLTKYSVQFINMSANSIVNEHLLDIVIQDDDIVYLNQHTLVIGNTQNSSITISNLQTKQQKLIQTKFEGIQSIKAINQFNLLILCNLEEQNYYIILNLKHNKITQIIKLENNNQIIIPTNFNNKYLLYVHDQINNQFNLVTTIDGERKASMIIEDIPENTNHSIQEKSNDFVKPTIINTNNQSLMENNHNLLKRHTISSQLRCIKTINIKDYLIPQSTKLPSLSFLQYKIVEQFRNKQQCRHLNQSLEFQNKSEQIEIQDDLIDIDSEREQSIQKKQNIDIQELKKLFKN